MATADWNRATGRATETVLLVTTKEDHGDGSGGHYGGGVTNTVSGVPRIEAEEPPGKTLELSPVAGDGR
ncbi:MAG: hypothetical protein D5R97_05960 [Candidatus Syntrophonatronum acetioxidans]|uniref:Uncharacterized protein n=1 Tax=Candidatus Syntrophonatronum acetioxidans TaxID=1795816 RepID=A0A424YD97_9FIRM|nr:MAG: hypothetical protein D5R97_05960 [Candidatus Syntrophonatronum acetioxidans]